jgi:hypothetical protein
MGFSPLLVALVVGVMTTAEISGLLPTMGLAPLLPLYLRQWAETMGQAPLLVALVGVMTLAEIPGILPAMGFSPLS